MTDDELWDMCYRWSRKMQGFGIADNDDLATEMWLACHEAMKRYDPTRGATERTWCYLHAKNAAQKARQSAHPMGRKAVRRGVDPYAVRNADVTHVRAKEAAYDSVDLWESLEEVFGNPKWLERLKDMAFKGEPLRPTRPNGCRTNAWNRATFAIKMAPLLEEWGLA